MLHIKHANNTKLLKGYMDALEKCRALEDERHVFLVMSFDEKRAEQFTKVKVIENPLCAIFDIDAHKRNDESSLIDFEKMGFTDEWYLDEKRRAGASSYQRHEELRSKVRALCQEELAQKTYSSASQLCRFVVGVIAREFLGLLSTFEPYEQHDVDGHDWTKPTFYGWCNEEYKAFKKRPIVEAV